MGAPNRAVFSATLLEMAKEDANIIAMVSDSAGSAGLKVFGETVPDQLVEVGIAEQNLVGISAGLAKSGKLPFVCSPASFLSMRSIEQVKVDVGYSRANVKLIGISGGVSYGALGSTHHSTHDLAVMRAIPDITIVLPSDNVSTEKLVRAIAVHDGPVYMRLGRGPVENFHSPDYEPVIGRGDVLRHGTDLTIVAAGEVTFFALEAGKALEDLGVSAEVIELATIKPLDAELVLRSAKKTGLVLTVEEHSVFGGLGGAVAELLSTSYPVPMKILGIPDEWAVVGSQREVFAHYGLDTAGIVAAAKAMLDANRV